jgi:hypothetical protein
MGRSLYCADARLKQLVHHISNPDGQIVPREASSITLHGTSLAPGKSQSFIVCQYRLALSWSLMKCDRTIVKTAKV